MSSRVKGLTSPATIGIGARDHVVDDNDHNDNLYTTVDAKTDPFPRFRLYHHTVTCLPIYPKEMDIDSEGENDPKWLQTKTMMMIDDFTDVNEGEKELMKMWNLHVMKHGYVGDCQIPLACQMFLENKGKELLMKNLYRNFVLHMCSLFDFGLISPVILYQTIQKLQEIMKEGGEDGDVRKVLQKSHEAQVERWAVTSSQTSTHDVSKTGTGAKVNFGGDGANSNARRKTSLPLGSPSTQSVKSTMSVHNNVSKHASMMASSSSSSKNIAHNSSMQNSVVGKNAGAASYGNATSMQSSITGGKVANAASNGASGSVAASKNASIASNGVAGAGQSENGASSGKQQSSSNDLPARRKSTNSIVQVNNAAESATPLRRKSMAAGESASTEYHRRKLMLDAIPPSNGVASQKPSPNGGSY